MLPLLFSEHLAVSVKDEVLSAALLNATDSDW